MTERPMLLGLRLQAAGLNFLSATARHSRSGTTVEEVICETEVDALRVRAWAAREKVELVTVRVATAEERERYKKMQESP